MEGSFSAVSQQNEWHATPDSQSPLYATEKYFQTVDHISNQQQQLPHENSSLFGCMLGADATCRESDLRNWRLRNQVASVVNSQFGNFFVLVSGYYHLTFFAQDLVVMSCMFPWILPPYFFAQDLVVMSCMFPWIPPPYFFCTGPSSFPAHRHPPGIQSR
jgi:hypothetical protein